LAVLEQCAPYLPFKLICGNASPRWESFNKTSRHEEGGKRGALICLAFLHAMVPKEQYRRAPTAPARAAPRHETLQVIRQRFILVVCLCKGPDLVRFIQVSV
jgi:hypothetical protein